MPRRSLIPTLTTHGGTAVRTVEEVMEKLLYRHKHRETRIAARVMDFGIRWMDQSSSHTESGYYAKIDGQDMLLSANALRTANRLIESKPSHWDQYPDRDAFSKSLVHILDNKTNDGYMLRHNGLQVNAILPGDYQVKDACELLVELIEPLEKAVGKINGISVIDQGDGDITSLRVIIGENIIPSLRDELGQYMMFLLNTSETGAIPTRSVLGLFRTICTNSAIRDATKIKEWNHRSEWDRFWEGTMDTLRQFGYFSTQFGEIFTGMLQAKLGVPAADILVVLHEQHQITNGHFIESQSWVDQPTEDGHPVETQYDLFNVLTKAAQGLQSIAAQHKAEQAALDIFPDAGGLIASLRTAYERQERSRNRRRV